MSTTPVPAALRAAVYALRADLAASSFSLGSEVPLPPRPRAPWSGRHRPLVSGSSVRLDVLDEVSGARTAVRVYEESAGLGGAPVVLSEWWYTLDRGAPVEGFGSWLRSEVGAESGSRLSAASNADVLELVRVASLTRFAGVVGHHPDDVAAALVEAGAGNLPLTLTLEHALALEDGSSSEVLAVATRVLADLAAGAPIEWAVRREGDRES